MNYSRALAGTAKNKCLSMGMNSRHSQRRAQAFQMDEAVRKILLYRGKKRDAEVRCINLKKAISRFDTSKRQQHAVRLSEIVLDRPFIIGLLK